MNTYTPKVAIDGAPWMMKDPNGGWVSLADHLEALRQANADPNDIEYVSPPPEKVETFKMVPVAEWERLVKCENTRNALDQIVRQIVRDHDADDAKIRTLLAEFDTPQPDGELMTVQLVERAVCELHAAESELRSLKPTWDQWKLGLWKVTRPEAGPCAEWIAEAEALTQARADRDVLAAEVRRVYRIANKHVHPDRSCSLEAQGYQEVDCMMIGALDGFAQRIVNPNFGEDQPDVFIKASGALNRAAQEASDGKTQ